MRYGELSFLALLVLYHAFLLLPRYRRPFPANYLVFAAGMALAWNLGLEGLRWQTGLPLALFLLDLIVLFPTFATLRGSMPRPGFLSGLGGTLRTLVALAALLLSLASVLLSVAFPLPRVELTGGITPSLRLVRFPAAGGHSGLELAVWYPAGGDYRRQPRAASEPEAWQRERAAEGLPVFWQSYLQHLPSSAVLGGKLATPQTKYPVVFVAVPRGQSPQSFAYLFEDLASRGMIVAAGAALPGPLAPAEAFTWDAGVKELLRPFEAPSLWLKPDAAFDKAARVDYAWLLPAREALRQLTEEPGDVLFEAVDWKRVGLWTWGTDARAPAAVNGWGLAGAVHAGDTAHDEPRSLWITDKAPANGPAGRWALVVPSLHRADLSDDAYLRPYLAFWGLKSTPDAGIHGVVRQYQAAYFQYVFWGSDDTAFRQTVPELPGYTLTGR